MLALNRSAASRASPSASGRGTLTVTSTLGKQTFAYYQVDDTRIKLVEIDGAVMLAGDLIKQPAGPFSSSSFGGRFAFTRVGSKSGGPFAMGGLFTMNWATSPSTLIPLSNGNFILYILDSSTALILESDGSRLLTGTMTRQY